MPPDRAEKIPICPKIGLRTSGARKLMAKNPSTIVGIPAIVSSTGLTIVRTRLDAYSDSRIADEQPERDGDDHRDGRDEQRSRSPAGRTPNW